LRKRGKKQTRKKAQKPYSNLSQHKQSGKLLNPPLLTLPNMQPSSWIDDRLPELLWCALLVTQLDRELALEVFRRVAKRLEGKFQPNKRIDIGHTGLTELPGELATEIIELICSAPGAREALRPLLLLDDLPLLDQWRNGIGHNPAPSDWDVLRIAVGHVFGHQSQEATDCRWLRVLVMLVSGQLRLPDQESIREILFYPDAGDQRKVRPSIRASEIGLANQPGAPAREWPSQFWQQCWRDTGCIPHPMSIAPSPPAPGTTVQRVEAVVRSLALHAAQTAATTAVDAKHDTTFGIAGYALAVLKELMRIGIPTSILARLGLRALLEAYVTLAYLAKKDASEIWDAYRRYGSGQAKLAFLKLDDDDMRRVGFVDSSALNAIANEDRSLEFVPINVGHWDSSNLRQMSEDAGVKSDYDRFYPWTSAYMHANWGATRSVVFDLCINALHRAHRVMRDAAAPLNDVVPDACELVDQILCVVDVLYPGFPHRVALAPSGGDTS
jgi:hypothetical protein